jgi:hypothetical protein
MNQSREIKALREEISKLRERVAVLEKSVMTPQLGRPVREWPRPQPPFRVGDLQAGQCLIGDPPQSRLESCIGGREVHIETVEVRRTPLWQQSEAYPLCRASS